MSGSIGDNVFRASGVIAAAAAGRTGTVDWQTDSIKTATFTATSAEGYFCNTTAGAFTVNLPAATAGDIVSLKDYANTWDTNNITLAPNGTDKINGVNGAATLDTEDQSVTLVYVDSTKGWRPVQDSTATVTGSSYVAATGGDATLTCGDYKTHVFTGPGTFCVSVSEGPLGVVDYMVIAGGASGGSTAHGGGGGGGGGFRMSNGYCLPATSPLAAPASLAVTVQGYPITVGAGGAAVPAQPVPGIVGDNSVFSTITSAGGGFGGGALNPPGGAGGAGGSGGGGGNLSPGATLAGGTGNSPPTSPPQGNTGGAGLGAVGPYPSPNHRQGGGGGAAGAVGTSGTPSTQGTPGGDGSYFDDDGFGPTAPTYGTPGPVASTRYFTGGGGGGVGCVGAGGTHGCGGAGGGANGGGGPAADSEAGTVNTGGGGGGGHAGPAYSNAGGSGVVVIRYRFQ